MYTFYFAIWRDTFKRKLNNFVRFERTNVEWANRICLTLLANGSTFEYDMLMRLTSHQLTIREKYVDHRIARHCQMTIAFNDDKTSQAKLKL